MVIAWGRWDHVADNSQEQNFSALLLSPSFSIKAHLQGSFLPELQLSCRSCFPSPLRSPKVEFHPLLDVSYGCRQGTCSSPPASNSLACFLPTFSFPFPAQNLYFVSIQKGEREDVGGWGLALSDCKAFKILPPAFFWSLKSRILWFCCFVPGSTIPCRYWRAEVDWLDARYSPAKRKCSKIKFV